MASSGDTVNPKDFKSLENFSAKASLCKTLIKKNREETERIWCASSLSEPSRKTIIETHKLEKGKFY